MKENTTSIFTGVSFDKPSRKWESKIKIDGKTNYLGRYHNEKVAALIRDIYVMNNLPNSHHKFNYQIMIDEYLTKNNIVIEPTKTPIMEDIIDDLVDVLA